MKATTGDSLVSPALRALRREAGRMKAGDALMAPKDDEQEAMDKGRDWAHDGRLGGSVALGSLFDVSPGKHYELTGYVAEMMDLMQSEVKPKDPLERMLLEQALTSHAAILAAHKVLARTTTFDGMDKASRVIERLSSDYRRAMLALRQYRAPYRQFVVAQQANIANQQIVNPNLNTATPSNELGTTAGGTSVSTAIPAMIAATPPMMAEVQPIADATVTTPKRARRKGA